MASRITSYDANMLLLSSQRQSWQDMNLSNYTFSFKKSCFCLPSYTSQKTYVVENGRVVSGGEHPTRRPLTEEELSQAQTIDEIFTEMESVVSGFPDRFSLSDSSSVFPMDMDVDRSFQMADEEYSLSLWDVREVTAEEDAAFLLAAEKQEQARATWKSADVSEYVYTYVHDCGMCVAADSAPKNVYVSDGKVTKVIDSETHVEVTNPDKLAEYHTIDTLFMWIDYAIASKVSYLLVEYDTTLGYPNNTMIVELPGSDERIQFIVPKLRSACSTMSPDQCGSEPECMTLKALPAPVACDADGLWGGATAPFTNSSSSVVMSNVACVDVQMCTENMPFAISPQGEIVQFSSGCLPNGWEVMDTSQACCSLLSSSSSTSSTSSVCSGSGSSAGHGCSSVKGQAGSLKDFCAVLAGEENAEDSLTTAEFCVSDQLQEMCADVITYAHPRGTPASDTSAYVQFRDSCIPPGWERTYDITPYCTPCDGLSQDQCSDREDCTLLAAVDAIQVCTGDNGITKTQHFCQDKAEAQVCADVETFALGPNGHALLFMTACLPDGWTAVEQSQVCQCGVYNTQDMCEMHSDAGCRAVTGIPADVACNLAESGDTLDFSTQGKFIGCIENMMCTEALTYVAGSKGDYLLPNGCMPNGYQPETASAACLKVTQGCGAFTDGDSCQEAGCAVQIAYPGVQTCLQHDEFTGVTPVEYCVSPAALEERICPEVITYGVTSDGTFLAFPTACLPDFVKPVPADAVCDGCSTYTPEECALQHQCTVISGSPASKSCSDIEIAATTLEAVGCMSSSTMCMASLTWAYEPSHGPYLFPSCVPAGWTQETQDIACSPCSHAGYDSCTLTACEMTCKGCPDTCAVVETYPVQFSCGEGTGTDYTHTTVYDVCPAYPNQKEATKSLKITLYVGGMTPADFESDKVNTSLIESCAHGFSIKSEQINVSAYYECPGDDRCPSTGLRFLLTADSHLAVELITTTNTSDAAQLQVKFETPELYDVMLSDIETQFQSKLTTLNYDWSISARIESARSTVLTSSEEPDDSDVTAEDDDDVNNSTSEKIIAIAVPCVVVGLFVGAAGIAFVRKKRADSLVVEPSWKSLPA
eukprot:TRINITY_DN7845_c0_g1::TRINITY_DN7845_c0_g1_i1::g.23723::m.23723 TRINITY_DN7845_c0_g1::TRINITY_DN7845_c0_g1_i1::g.23723  ORF type:complete len:1206 (-),score=348.29,DUF4448/PF14610.1/1.1e+03,DUF4448/PF14610.1/0.0033,IL12/PF03039.9/0.12,DUF3377/PF11857.3/0.15 TRINITY_DN7845_c0_g1_i1:253-3552(-)